MGVPAAAARVEQGAILALTLGVTLLSGCFAPQIADGQYACAAGGLCPVGFACGADNLCHTGGGGLADAGAVDHAPLQDQLLSSDRQSNPADHPATSGMDHPGGGDLPPDHPVVGHDGAMMDAAVMDSFVPGVDLGVDSMSLPDVGATDVPGCVGGCAAPTVLASGQAYPIALAVDDTRVYWTNNNGEEIRSVPIGGGASAQVASAQNNPSAIAVQGGVVYWLNYGDNGSSNGQVMRLTLATNLLENLVSSQPVPSAIVLDATNVYWLNADSGEVRKVPVVSPFSPTTLATATPNPAGLSLAQSTLYWGSETSNDLLKVAAGGTGPAAPTVFLDLVNAAPIGIATFAGRLYWVGDDGAVGQIGLDGTGKQILATNQPAPSAIAVDASGVYWVNSGTPGGQDGSIVKLPAGGSSVVLASAQDYPLALVLDANNVYWVNAGANSANTGAVMRVAK